MKIFGVGINDSGYAVRPRNSEGCPLYAQWKAMLWRCYSDRGPYRGRTVVCHEWLLFSQFRLWMSEQVWEGCDLDKDILGDGSEYSPETCAFVPHSINMLLVDSAKDRLLPQGVYRVGQRNRVRYEAKLKHCGSTIFLGIFDSIEEASAKWQEAKVASIRQQLSNYRKHPGFRQDVLDALLRKIPHIVED